MSETKEPVYPVLEVPAGYRQVNTRYVMIQGPPWFPNYSAGPVSLCVKEGDPDPSNYWVVGNHVVEIGPNLSSKQRAWGEPTKACVESCVPGCAHLVFTIFGPGLMPCGGMLTAYGKTGRYFCPACSAKGLKSVHY